MWKDISETTVRVERQMVKGGLNTPVFELPRENAHGQWTSPTIR